MKEVWIWKIKKYSLTYFPFSLVFIRKSKACKITDFLYYQFVYILRSEGGNVIATSQNRLVSENIPHPERVVT